MLPIVLIAVAAVITVFLIVVALQPSEFRVARTVVMAAPAGAIFDEVNDFHRWRPWSPYETLDPQMERRYEGPQAGPGASYAWKGNKDVGEGRSTIVESRPNDLVRIKLEFVRPFACTNTVEFTFKPQGDQTAVTWSLAGRNSFLSKAVGLFMNMDKMIGGQFDQGLTQLKSLVEEGPRSTGRQHAHHSDV